MKHPVLSLVVQRSVIKGIIMEFEPVIWLEFHAQLKTKTWIFFVLNIIRDLAQNMAVTYYYNYYRRETSQGRT